MAVAIGVRVVTIGVCCAGRAEGLAGGMRRDAAGIRRLGKRSPRGSVHDAIFRRVARKFVRPVRQCELVFEAGSGVVGEVQNHIIRCLVGALDPFAGYNVWARQRELAQLMTVVGVCRGELEDGRVVVRQEFIRARCRGSGPTL